MRRLVLPFVCLSFFTSGAFGADLTVISGGAVRPGLMAATTAFLAETGHRVQIVFSSTPQIKERVASGGVFDVVIAPPGAMAEFFEAGRIGSTGVTIGSVGAGVVVRQGATIPKIETSDQVKQAVINADSVVFNRASSGRYIEQLMIDMGVWSQIVAKTTRYPRSNDVMQHLLTGSGKELGFGPITGILAYKEKGLVLVGPLPSSIQKLRAYHAAPMAASEQGDLANAYISFLIGSEGKPHFIAAGIE